MKVTNWFMVMFVSVASLFSCTSSGTDQDSEETHVKTFCAYNRVFVEFKEGNSVWGALMLDWNGNPIRCNETEVDAEPTTYKKEII